MSINTVTPMTVDKSEKSDSQVNKKDERKQSRNSRKKEPKIYVQPPVKATKQMLISYAPANDTAPMEDDGWSVGVVEKSKQKKQMRKDKPVVLDPEENNNQEEQESSDLTYDTGKFQF